MLFFKEHSLTFQDKYFCKLIYCFKVKGKFMFVLESKHHFVFEIIDAQIICLYIAAHETFYKFLSVHVKSCLLGFKEGVGSFILEHVSYWLLHFLIDIVILNITALVLLIDYLLSLSLSLWIIS